MPAVMRIVGRSRIMQWPPTPTTSLLHLAEGSVRHRAEYQATQVASRVSLSLFSSSLKPTSNRRRDEEGVLRLSSSTTDQGLR